MTEEKSFKNNGKEQDESERGWGKKEEWQMWLKKEENHPKHLQIAMPCLGRVTWMSTWLQFLLLLFHHHPAGAIADEQVILLLGQIFIKAALTNTRIHPHMHWHTPQECIWHNPGLIKGRISIISRTTHVRLFTDCTGTTEPCFS